MKKFVIVLVVLGGILNILAKEPTLELVEIWACDPVLQTPESVIYDPIDSLFYVSNIVGDPLAADGNGYISQINTRGEIVQKKWITGLNAPKGMGIYEGILFIADLTELVEIDISTSGIINKYPVQGAKLLNDIAVDEKGYVYISETAPDNDIIYRFRDGITEEWHHSDYIKRPNGLYVDHGILIVGSSGTKHIAAIRLEDSKVIKTVRVNTIIDGITKLDKDSYIFSDWYGKIYHLNDFKEVEQLIDLIPLKQNAADLFYSKELDLLIVPTFFNDRIRAFQIFEK
ncbi:hypothetical protein ACFLYK_02765 [Candidatus Cloacimonadota bacterium]